MAVLRGRESSHFQRARARVSRGAACLDCIEPLWYLRLDLDAVNLGTNEGSILVQLFGSYCRGRWRVMTSGVNLIRISRLGFRSSLFTSSALREEEIEFLLHNWFVEIERRRAADRYVVQCQLESR